MGAAAAAQALIDHEAVLAATVASLDDIPETDTAQRQVAVVACLRGALGLPLLTLVADASSSSKRQVIEALSQHPRLNVGGEPVSRQVIDGLFLDRS